MSAIQEPIPGTLVLRPRRGPVVGGIILALAFGGALTVALSRLNPGIASIVVITAALAMLWMLGPWISLLWRREALRLDAHGIDAPGFRIRAVPWDELASLRARRSAALTHLLFVPVDLQHYVAHRLGAYRWLLRGAIQRGTWTGPYVVSNFVAGGEEAVVQAVRRACPRLPVVLTLILALVACGRDATKVIGDDQALARSLGAWQGTLPCTDCAGIRVELQLFAEAGHDDGSFELRETQLGTKDGDKSLAMTGNWILEHGIDGDPAATVYRLNPGGETEERHYLKASDDTLELLDTRRKRIESKLNYSLKRVAP